VRIPSRRPAASSSRHLKTPARYIQLLQNKDEQQRPNWQLAVETLISAAEGRDFLMHARRGMLRALSHGKPNPDFSQEEGQDLQDRQMKTVWIYIDTSKEVGDANHFKVFASTESANDPEGVAF
jgi:hypothetical protein